MKDQSTWDRRSVLRMGAAAVTLGTIAPAFPLTAQAADKATVKIISADSTIILTLQQMMKQQGYLEELGITPEHVNARDGTSVVASLVSGTADLCMEAGMSALFPAMIQGAKIKILAGAFVESDNIIYANKPEIKTVKDLEGHTIGTGAPGALLHTLMVAVLKKSGVDPENVNFVNIGSGSDVFKAVAAHTIDAGPSQVEFIPLAARYGAHTLTDGELWTALPEWTQQISCASTDTIARKRDALVRTLAAYGKLYRFISSPESLDSYMQAHDIASGKSDEETRAAARNEWDFIQKYHPYDVALTVGEDRVSYMQGLNVDVGVQKQTLPYDRVADMSLANEALKLIGS